MQLKCSHRNYRRQSPTEYHRKYVVKPGPAFLLCMFALTTQSHAATRVFADGFEDGTANAWSKDDGRNKCVPVKSGSASGSPHTGAYAVQCNWNGNLAWNDPNNYLTLVKKFSATKETFVRFWLLIQSDMDTSPDGNNPKLLRITGSNFSDQVYMTLTPAPSRNINFHGVTASGSQFPTGWSIAGMGSSQWHKIEVYQKSGAGGQAKVWVDGNLEYTFSGNTGGIWNTFYMSSNWSGGSGCCTHDTSNHNLWDDIEIYSDATTGTSATGSMSDATIRASGTPSPSGSLAPPKNLHIP